MKTGDAVNQRSLKLARSLWLAVVPAFVIISVLTWFVRPQLLEGIAVRPVAWVTLLICVASGYAIVTGLRRQREHLTFLGSTFLLFGPLDDRSSRTLPGDALLHDGH